jgi:glucosamine-6-phosphate deaminase
MVQELFGLLQSKFREVNVPWGTLIDQDIFEAELKANPGDWEYQGTDKGKAVVIKRDASSEYLRWIRREILDAYEEKIEKRGGIDLHVIGVGSRGHVGFHESGIPFERNRVLLIKLDEDTITNAVRDGHFSSRDACPLYAVSMGAELIYKAKTVLLLANGQRKADAIANALLRGPNCSVPVSYGHLLSQRGGRMIFVIDRLAAAGILDKADQLHKHGIELDDCSSSQASVAVADLRFSRDARTGRIQ